MRTEYRGYEIERGDGSVAVWFIYKDGNVLSYRRRKRDAVKFVDEDISK